MSVSVDTVEIDDKVGLGAILACGDCRSMDGGGVRISFRCGLDTYGGAVKTGACPKIRGDG